MGPALVNYISEIETAMLYPSIEQSIFLIANECFCVSKTASVSHTNVVFVDEFVLIELVYHNIW